MSLIAAQSFNAGHVDFPLTPTMPLWTYANISATYNKQRGDTLLYASMFCDMVADPTNSIPDNYFLGVWSLGRNRASQALVSLPDPPFGGDITFYFLGPIGGFSAGNVTFDLMVGSTKNTRALYKFSDAMDFTIFEVLVPVD